MSAAANVAAIGGSMLSGIAQWESAAAQADMMNQEAFLQEGQAHEVGIAAEREIRLTQKREEAIKADAIGAYAKSGMELTGSPLLMLEQIASDSFEEQRAIRHAAQFRQSQLLQAARAKHAYADDTMEAGILNAYGTILGGTGGTISRQQGLGSSGNQGFRWS